MVMGCADYCVEEVLVPSTWHRGVGGGWGSAWRDSVGVAYLREKTTHSVSLWYNVFSGDARHLLSATSANIPASRGFVRFFWEYYHG